MAHTHTLSPQLAGTRGLTPLRLLPILLRQWLQTQRLERTPEPTSSMVDEESVRQFDQAFSTRLVLTYAAALELLEVVLPPVPAKTGQGGGRRRALDLACGPGHFTLMLACRLGFSRVQGIDCSVPMIQRAEANCRDQALSGRVSFQHGDATQLADLAGGDFDLCTCTYAGHHLADLSQVRCLLQEMDRVTRPDGTLFVLDLVRLRTAALTERYVSLIGAEYLRRGLNVLYEDFRSSMYAAWTPQELRQAVPPDTHRRWCILVPWGFPVFQALVGLPAGHKPHWVRPFPTRGQDDLIPTEFRLEWKALRVALRLGQFIP